MYPPTFQTQHTVAANETSLDANQHNCGQVTALDPRGSGQHQRRRLWQQGDQDDGGAVGHLGQGDHPGVGAADHQPLRGCNSTAFTYQTIHIFRRFIYATDCRTQYFQWMLSFYNSFLSVFLLSNE